MFGYCESYGEGGFAGWFVPAGESSPIEREAVEYYKWSASEISKISGASGQIILTLHPNSQIEY